MGKKKIEPTDAMVRDLEFRKKLVAMGPIGALRYVLNHPDAAGLFADEDALRAAREQGWDEAAGWVWQREAWTDDELRAANPHRPVQELPTKPRTVIVRADGRKYIEAEVGGVVWRTREAILSSDGRWHGVWRAGSVAVGSTSADSITPGTWKVDEK